MSKTGLVIRLVGVIVKTRTTDKDNDMQYMLLIYAAENADPKPDTAEFGAMFQAYMDFNKETKAAGAHIAGQALQPIPTATTVRVKDNKTHTSDGPFAETKEVLGGYYLLDCKDLDEALAWAAKIPTAAWGSIEVRPIMDIGE